MSGLMLKVKHTLSGMYHAFATHESGANEPRTTLPQRMVQKGCSQGSNAGPRDYSKLPYPGHLATIGSWMDSCTQGVIARNCR